MRKTGSVGDRICRREDIVEYCEYVRMCQPADPVLETILSNNSDIFVVYKVRADELAVLVFLGNGPWIRTNRMIENSFRNIFVVRAGRNSRLYGFDTPLKNEMYRQHMSQNK